MTQDEILKSKEKRKQELLVLKSELDSLKPGRAVYYSEPFDSATGSSGAGQVLFKQPMDLANLKSSVNRELSKLK